MSAHAGPVTRPPDLVSLADAVGERSIDVDRASRFLAGPGSVAVGGHLDGRPAGYLIAYLVTRIDGEVMLVVYDVSVAAPLRRRGVGTAMVEEVLRIAGTAGATKAWVLTDHGNEPARAMYRATGAIASDRDDLVMWWRVGYP